MQSRVSNPREKAINVLFVLEYYPPHIGGVEILFKNLCEGLAQRGHKVALVTSRLAGTQAMEVVNGVTIRRVRVPRRGSRYWFTFLSIPQVLKSARGADVVHTTTYNGAFPAWLISKLLGKRCIITVLEVLGSLWKDLAGISWFSAKLYQLLEQLIISLPFDRYVCISKYTHNSLKMAGAKDYKLGVIYLGINSDLFDPKKADGESIRRRLGLENHFLYMYYGRPGITKGVEYLVQSVPLVAQRIPDSKLLLILANDPANRYESIKKIIKDLNIMDWLILLDPVPRTELPNYIAAADCVVVPSLSEGFGFTAAEACAMGKPVVASRVGSLPEVVSGRYVLVEPGSPEAIAKGVENVYRGKTENSEKEVFNWSRCVEEYLEVYNKVLNNRE